MVNRALPIAAFLALAAAAAACQLIAGVQDKTLAPGQSGADAGAEAADDHAVPDTAEEPSAHDAADATSEEAGPNYDRKPPPRPAGDAGPSDAGKTITFAARTFYLGAIDPDTDETTWEAWRKLGYDLDGKCTTVDESLNDLSGVCHKPPSANQFAHEDGFECRDNVVGHELAGALKLLSIDYERALQAQYRSGDLATLVLQLLDLDDGPDDPYVPARIYITAPFGSAPLWDGSDRPVIDSSSVLDGGLDDPKYTVTGYVKDDIWVSGDYPGSPMTLPLVAFDRVMEVPTKSVLMTVQLDADHKRSLRSVFAIAMGGPEMIPVVMPALLDVVNCNEPAARALFEQYFSVNRDLSSTSPDFVDPTVVCDTASFGVMVDWRPVRAPDTVQDVPPTPYPCDAGAD